MKILITIPNQGNVKDFEELQSIINRMNGEIEPIPDFNCGRSFDFADVIKEFQTIVVKDKSNVVEDKSKSKYHK